MESIGISPNTYSHYTFLDVADIIFGPTEYKNNLDEKCYTLLIGISCELHLLFFRSIPLWCCRIRFVFSTRESPPPGKPQGKNRVEWENTSQGRILKKFRQQKKQNFEKRSKTFLGILVRKLYLNFQLCRSIDVEVLCWTYKQIKTEQSLIEKGRPGTTLFIELYRKNAPLLEGLLFYEEFNQNIHSDVLLFCLCPQLIVGLTGYAWV